MAYSWSFGKTFAREFKNIPSDDQTKVLQFIETYETHGLRDFSLYTGKIVPSWSGEKISIFNHDYARRNHLWHYHVGIPTYRSVHPRYATSDYLLHFQWRDKGDEIVIVDLYSHYTSAGDFYFPPQVYLE